MNPNRKCYWVSFWWVKDGHCGYGNTCLINDLKDALIKEFLPAQAQAFIANDLKLHACIILYFREVSEEFYNANMEASLQEMAKGNNP